MKAKKFLALLLALCMICTVLVGTASAEESEEGYYTFIGFGGDKDAENDWGWGYAGEENVAEGITATTAMVKPGETVTIALEFATPVVNTWWIAPVVIAEGANKVELTLESVKLDGAEVEFTMPTEEKNIWWYEGTGDYSNEQAIRLMGGFNNWAEDASCIERPVNFSKVEFTYTLNAISFGEVVQGNVVESTESYPATIQFGGDKAAENDWGLNYDGSAEVEGITVEGGTFTSGVETTLTMTFAEPVFNVWYFHPHMTIEDPSILDASTTFDVQLFIDGEEIAINAEGLDNWWDEGGVRVSGGWNEWGNKYIEEPANFTEIKYVITPHIFINEGAIVPEVDFDTTATYHAYLGVQTPTWAFRNAWDDGSYGMDKAEIFSTVGRISNETNEWEALGGTFTDVEIYGDGNYTVALHGMDFTNEMGDEGLFNLLFVSTDLPVTDKVTITNVKLVIDGKEITTQDTAYLDADAKEYQKVLLANIWNSGITALPYYAAPTESIEISFDVTGFGFEKAVEETPVETEPAVVETEPAATEAPIVEKASSSNTAVIVIVAIVVIAAAAAAGVVVAKKKKQ